MMDKFTLQSVCIFKAQNGGWVVLSSDDSDSGYMTKTHGAFTNKADLMDWLLDHLYEPIKGEKQDESYDR